MTTRHKLTIETLTELGARKLAELLLAEATGNRQLKQTLNLAISAKEGHPPTSKAPDRPDFHRGLGFARCFARKGGEVADRLRRMGQRERRSAGRLRASSGGGSLKTTLRQL